MTYRVYLSTIIKTKSYEKGSGIIVLEPDNYSDTEIKRIKSKGYKVLGYLSVGTIEKERSWYKDYKKYRLQQLEDWPNEWYVDVSKKAWQEFVIKRAKKLKERGFDGFWCDNIDVYEYNKKKAIFNGCKDILKSLKKIGYVMVNGGSEFFDKAMDDSMKISGMVNGVTQEEVFSRITSYKGKGKFGTQTKDQHNFYTKYMIRLKSKGVQTFLLEYTRSDSLKKKIKDWCKKYEMTGYYISEDVDL